VGGGGVGMGGEGGVGGGGGGDGVGRGGGVGCGGGGWVGGGGWGGGWGWGVGGGWGGGGGGWGGSRVSGRNDSCAVSDGTDTERAVAGFLRDASIEFNDDVSNFHGQPGIWQRASSPLKQLLRPARVDPDRRRVIMGDTDRHTPSAVRRFALRCRGGHGALEAGRTVIGQKARRSLRTF